MAAIKDNLQALEARIQAACQRSGRERASLQFLAVSKFQDLSRIEEAAAQGLKAFAESRQQEASQKLPRLKSLGEWHFIGHLQTNKAASIAELFDVVESVDSSRLAQKLSAAARAQGKGLRIYAQVNISGEAQKHGFAPEGAEAEILALGALPGLKLEGLMGMAAQAPESEVRESFKALGRLRQRLAPSYPGLKLSMGMSDDFEIAIEEGADLIRIGSALFA
jgi:pyridoxal phosphate enzyme (YggS family)